MTLWPVSRAWSGNNTSVAAVIDGINLNITRDGAAAQFGLGSSAAQGVLRGVVTISGSVRIFFRDFTLYDDYKAETARSLSYRSVDDTGSGYQITLPSAILLNPNITAGGPAGGHG
jgi:hypothetical protein